MAYKASCSTNTKLRHSDFRGPRCPVLFRSEHCPFKIESLKVFHNIFVSRYLNSC